MRDGLPQDVELGEGVRQATPPTHALPLCHRGWGPTHNALVALNHKPGPHLLDPRDLAP